MQDTEYPTLYTDFKLDHDVTKDCCWHKEKYFPSLIEFYRHEKNFKAKLFTP